MLTKGNVTDETVEIHSIYTFNFLFLVIFITGFHSLNLFLKNQHVVFANT